MSTATGNKTFTFELETGLGKDEDNIEITVCVRVTAYEDKNYGADADGNRGVSVWFTEDWEYDIESCSKEVKKLKKEQIIELENKIEKRVDEVELD